MSVRIVLLATVATMALAAMPARSENDADSRTVIGPRNIYLFDGAAALLAGDAEEGVALTLRGLELAVGMREEKIGHSNLCAGYVLLQQAEKALEHCNWVLERDPYHWRSFNNRALAFLRLERFEEAEADIIKGQELNPRAENLKEVKGLYLDEVEPVDERVTIDERRDAAKTPTEIPE